MSIMIPPKLEFKGNLIILKTVDYKYLKPMKKILSDLKTMEHLLYMAKVPKGWTNKDVKERFDSQLTNQKKQEGLSFTVIDKKTNEVIGSCGCNNIDLTHKHATFGLIIHHTAWGKGVAAECHLLCLQYLFSTLKIHRVEMGTFPNNIRMRKFCEGIGFKMECIKKDFFAQNGKYVDDVVYVLFEKDWPAAKKKLKEKVAKQGGHNGHQKNI